MDDCALLDAAEAYQNERALWNIRTNKSFSPTRYEIIRRPNNSDPCVMASTTGWNTALSELEEMSMIAAMKEALKVVGV